MTTKAAKAAITNGAAPAATAVASRKRHRRKPPGSVAVARVVNTARPVLTVDAAIYQGVGTAPGPLPVDKSAYFPPLFTIAAIRNDLRTQFLTAIWTVVLIVYGLLAPPVTALVFLGIVGGGTVAFYVSFWMAVAGSVTRVHVLRKAEGWGIRDVQKWWKKEVNRWPVMWRRPIKGLGDVLEVDALEYDPARWQATLYPFNPWLAPMPTKPKDWDDSFQSWHAPSTAKLGLVWAKRRAARSILDTHDPKARIVAQAGILILTGIALLFLYLGGVKLADSTSGESRAAMEGRIQDRVRQQLLNELTRPTPIQPFSEGR